MKDYRITVKVRNNRILKAIEEAGGTPGLKWCEANDFHYPTINDLINMTASPLNSKGELRQSAIKLCDVLNKLPEDLWSNDQLYPLEKNFSELEMDRAQLVALLPPEEQSYLQDFSKPEKEEANAVIASAIATLTEKEQAVLKMRFEEGLTYEECAKRIGGSSKRARQIEVKALRKLRHPSRSISLRSVADVYDVIVDRKLPDWPDPPGPTPARNWAHTDIPDPPAKADLPPLPSGPIPIAIAWRTLPPKKGL